MALKVFLVLFFFLSVHSFKKILHIFLLYIHYNNMKKYAKYILTNGNITEKRELLSCLRSKLTLADRKLEINS